MVKKSMDDDQMMEEFDDEGSLEFDQGDELDFTGEDELLIEEGEEEEDLIPSRSEEHTSELQSPWNI